MNREIRRFFPKGTDFNGIDLDWFSHVIERINCIPREKFGWQNSNQMVQKWAA